ncbi:MAG: FAD/NAD(P)-binding protein [Planctomycetes bacterium]|nr:FAD/NAD(P)-binding protein [Planctomycetota bacterium]
MGDNGKDIYLPAAAEVVRVEQMTKQEKFFEFRLASGKPLGHMPGQFAEVSLPGIGEAPISISSSPTSGDTFEMVVRQVGNVSGAMHRLEPGDEVGVRGPFGTTFPVDGELKGRDLLFICGGIGLVPVRSAINYVLDKRGDYGKVTVLFGAKTPGDRLFVDELAALDGREDVEFLETVDDTCGEKWNACVGVITMLFEKIEVSPESTTSIICGPPVMYKFAIMGLHEMGFTDDRIYVSLERRMKCGVGKCGHCQINGLYTCQDGPVFRYSDVAEVREAI